MVAMAALAAASSMVTVAPSCSGSTAAQGRGGTSQRVLAVALKGANKQVWRLGEGSLTAGQSRQRGVSRGSVKISAVAVNGAAGDVAETGG